MSSSTELNGSDKSLAMDSLAMDVEQSVRERYSAASQQSEAALCCPVDYDPQYLKLIPAEIIEKDYGCGDPSKFVQPGDTVLDLGSGGGKICYIASQVVGEHGNVIGVDVNDDMLALARSYQAEVGQKIGYENLSFRKGRIQDLSLNLELFETYLDSNPITSTSDWLKAESYADELRQTSPLIESDSVDVIVSNCVLNLVDAKAREQLFSEMYRVLKRGGRAVISDIVSDEVVPEHLRNDPHLWSGCLSGAFQEQEFIKAFTDAGFYGIETLQRQQEPWATIEGIEFRSVTLRAYKGKDGPCDDYNQAVIYQGPWKSVTDDDGHVLRRGVPMAVCQKTYEIYNRAPYSDQILPVPPSREVASENAKPFDCRRNVVRDPRETKGNNYDLTVIPGTSCCEPDCC